MLIRIIEERFMVAANLPDVDTVWSKYFCKTVNGIPVTNYITKAILPQPRDVIYLIRTALANAINRRHSIIEEQDLIEAQRSYSQYAIDSLDAENAIHFPHLLEFLHEFVGVKEILNQAMIIKAMTRCSIPEHRLQEAVDLLCDLAFLGREVDANRFQFQQNEQEKTKLMIMARRVIDSHISKEQRFKINEPFHSYLEIKCN